MATYVRQPSTRPQRPAQRRAQSQTHAMSHTARPVWYKRNCIASAFSSYALKLTRPMTPRALGPYFKSRAIADSASSFEDSGSVRPRFPPEEASPAEDGAICADACCHQSSCNAEYGSARRQPFNHLGQQLRRGAPLPVAQRRTLAPTPQLATACESQ